MKPGFTLALMFLALSSPGRESIPVTSQPSPPLVHFHHLHLNTLDPAGAINFYTSRFDCEKARFLGHDAVWAQRSWVLFNKVKTAPPAGLTSAIWHFGWGAEDMKAAYQKQIEMGTKFFTPLTDISAMLGGSGSGRFFYAYVAAPDGALVELNTSSNHQFGHLHLFSADPIAAGEWYVTHFGLQRRGPATPSREPRFFRDHQIGPSSSLVIDNVNIIIYPVQYSLKAYAADWQPGQTKISSTKGRVVDHIAFSVDNLAATIDRLNQEGVKIVERISADEGGKLKHAFIEGPDYIRIELVEGGARRD